MIIKDSFLRTSARFALIVLFWLPPFFALFHEISRAWFNSCLLNQVKSEYRAWWAALNDTKNYLAKEKVDKLHK